MAKDIRRTKVFRQQSACTKAIMTNDNKYYHKHLNDTKFTYTDDVRKQLDNARIKLIRASERNTQVVYATGQSFKYRSPFTGSAKERAIKAFNHKGRFKWLEVFTLTFINAVSYIINRINGVK